MRILFVIIVREKKLSAQLVQPEPVSKLSRRSHQVNSKEDEEEEEEEDEDNDEEDSEQDEGSPSSRALKIDVVNLKDNDDSGGGDSSSGSDGS